MKFKALLAGLLCLFVSLPFAGMAAGNSKERGDLTVNISNIRNNQGVIRIAMYNSKANYDAKDPNGELAFRRNKLPIENGKAVWKLKDLPYGYYGIKLFHDEENTGKFKRNLVGLPKEGYGFSNNPKVTTHAPAFEEVKFAVEQPKTSINIRMNNP